MLMGQQHNKEIIMSNLIVADTSIAINKDGLYSLNDMHKAALIAGHATEHHKPANFIRNEGVMAYIAAVESEAHICALKVIKGGKSGTWAAELVAMKYAGWISPAYEVQVYQVAQALKAGEIAKAVNLSGSKAAKSALDDMRHAKTVEMQLSNVERFRQLFPNLGDRANQAFAAALLNPVIGIDAIPLPKIEEKFYTTTELAEEFETTSQMLGRLANQNNMKMPEFGEYRLSKSQHSDKQVEQWYWNEAGREGMRDIMVRARA